VSQKHDDFIFKYLNKVTSFDLQSHNQAILNYISIGTLSGSAHLWDPEIFTLIKPVGIIVIIVRVNYNKICQ